MEIEMGIPSKDLLIGLYPGTLDVACTLDDLIQMLAEHGTRHNLRSLDAGHKIVLDK